MTYSKGWFLEYFVAAQEDILDDRERQILDLRYGLSDGQPRTLEEVVHATLSRLQNKARKPSV